MGTERTQTPNANCSGSVRTRNEDKKRPDVFKDADFNRGMVYRVYSGTMIVTIYRFTGIQVHRVYRESTGSTVRYTGLQVYRESTDSI